MNRKFKGVWIPWEIFDDKNLSWTEKFLFIEINRICAKYNVCDKSNLYFSKLFDITETNVSKSIKSLKSNGYFKQIRFDGRKRILIPMKKVEYYE